MEYPLSEVHSYSLTAIMIGFLQCEVTVNETAGVVILTLVKSGQTVMDYDLEIRLTPGTAGRDAPVINIIMDTPAKNIYSYLFNSLHPTKIDHSQLA